jgi:hypothetical protein
MIRLLLLALVTATLAAGCCTQQQSGSREFIPGKGWVPND